jgi:hypothetical protein
MPGSFFYCACELPIGDIDTNDLLMYRHGAPESSRVPIMLFQSKSGRTPTRHFSRHGSRTYCQRPQIVGLMARAFLYVSPASALEIGLGSS